VTDAEAEAGLTPEQARIVAEIRRVASALGVTSLSQNDFDEHHRLGGVTTAGYQFGSWNEAVQAAGLEPYVSGTGRPKTRISDDVLLEDIIRVHRMIGAEPSERRMSNLGVFSLKPFKARWGSLAAARQAAYARFGRPDDKGASSREGAG
jgi:hypothetical protein